LGLIVVGDVVVVNGVGVVVILSVKLLIVFGLFEVTATLDPKILETFIIVLV
jgi:hypothetical protein